jgi:hypothetical protein
MECGGSSHNRQITERVLVGHSLNRVGREIWRELKCEIVGIKARLIFADVDIGELIRRPEGRFVQAFGVEDLCVELTCCA